MNTADFLFPSDLEVTPTKFSRMLIIGSCLSGLYVEKFKEFDPSCSFDYVLFNNAVDLPEMNAAIAGTYDLQYIQIPLRSVLTDAAVRIADNDQSEDPIAWVELGKKNIDMMLEKAMSYNSEHGILTLVSTFIVPQVHLASSLWDVDTQDDLTWVVRQLNAYLASRVRTYNHAYIADVDIIAASMGKRYFLDDMIGFATHGALFYGDWSAHEMYPAWTTPETGRIEPIPDLGVTYENKNHEFFEAVYRQVRAIYRTVKQADMIKVVIFDLDNTMWRGQLVEHYQDGLNWPYSDGWPLGIWEAVHYLKRRGIIVTIASKNDEELVIKKWGDAVQPPFLKYDDFVAPQINWEPKAQNIRKILDDLSLTPASALFIDDNPVERESVRLALPGIRTLGADPFVIRRLLLLAPEMQISKRSDESLRRESMLKRQMERETERSQMSRDDFLRSLGTTVEIREICSTADAGFTRVAELVNKTNQFNTNGVRWSIQDYQAHLQSAGRILAFSVKDRFTEYGTVGVAFLQKNEIVQFIMSCRVLGMDIETAIVEKLVEVIRSTDSGTQIDARIIQTEANTPCRKVYLNSGFKAVRLGHFVLAPGLSPKHAEHVSISMETVHKAVA